MQLLFDFFKTHISRIVLRHTSCTVYNQALILCKFSENSDLAAKNYPYAKNESLFACCCWLSIQKKTRLLMIALSMKMMHRYNKQQTTGRTTFIVVIHQRTGSHRFTTLDGRWRRRLHNFQSNVNQRRNNEIPPVGHKTQDTNVHSHVAERVKLNNKCLW